MFSDCTVVPHYTKTGTKYDYTISRGNLSNAGIFQCRSAVSYDVSSLLYDG